MEKYFDERLHKALKDATWAIQDYIEEYRNEVDYSSRLTFILFSVISSIIEIAEARGDCPSEYIWSEMEKMTKEGGLTAVAEKIKGNRSYSISEIDPQDVGSGMNYLGQQVSVALHKHIHDLPVQQRKPEMFLRALETVFANLLNQKFADLDQHKIVDSFCEHIHMALDDKSSWAQEPQKPNLKLVKPEPNKTNDKPKTAPITRPKSNIEATVIKLDKMAIKVISKGGSPALLEALPEFIPHLDKIMLHENMDEIDELCEKYQGFHELMLVIEVVSGGIKSGTIKLK
jgi:hypothetical protein